MSQAAHAFRSDQPPDPTSDRPAWLTMPPEGAVSVIAVLAMLLVVGAAVDHAGWVGDVRGQDTSRSAFLPILMAIGGIVGLLLARAPISPLRAHLAGAIVGGLLLVYFVAGVVSTAPSLGDRLRGLNWSVHSYYWDSVVLGVRSNEVSVFLLLIGALLWSAAQLGSFSVFRRRRAGPLIALGAGMLLLNMSLTTHDQLIHLVVFAAAMLLLLVRLNLLSEAAGWRARRLVDIGEAGQLFLSRGAAFIALAVVASVTLAGTASSAPLSRAWRDMDSHLLSLGYEVNRWMGGVSGSVRGPTNLFGPTQRLRDTWHSSNQPVFSAQVGDGGSYYWRGATYDSFDGREWLQLDALPTAVAAGTETFARTAENLDGLQARREVMVTVTSHSLGGDVMVVPESPLAVDRPTELLSHRGEGGFAMLRLADGLSEGTQYSAIALVAQTSGTGAITERRLAAAGTDYPRWLNRYREIRPGSIGARTHDTADEIVADLPAGERDPFHIAEAMQDWFQSGGGFTYRTDVSGTCVDENLVDCFLDVKVGFCERFATAMTMMLRTQGIPARYVVGYLPGQRTGEGTWTVDGSASHAWVEVYFPGYGWYRFDPTPGNTVNGQAPTQLVEGGPVPSAAPTPVLAPRPTEAPDDDVILPPRGQPRVPSEGAGDALGLGLLPLVLLALVVLAGAAFVFARRMRRQPLEAARAWAGLTALATRLGHGPRPHHTVYEYTGRLSQLVPAVRADLDLIATAKVEATYARRESAWGVGQRLGDAYRRARVGLLRLLLRSPRWMRRPTQLGERRP